MAGRQLPSIWGYGGTGIGNRMHAFDKKKLIRDCARANPRTDKHLDAIREHINKKIYKDPRNKDHPLTLRSNGMTKCLDRVYENSAGVHGIEMKTITGSHQKNVNNRIEEMCGQALLAKRNYNLKTFRYIFVINCKMKDEYKSRFLRAAEISKQEGHLDDYCFFDVNKGSFLNNQSFENWDFN